MPIPTLPPLPAYPATAGAERDEWHRVANLHAKVAAIEVQEKILAEFLKGEPGDLGLAGVVDGAKEIGAAWGAIREAVSPAP